MTQKALLLLVFLRFLCYNTGMKTVTITKAEYDALIANQAHLEQQVKYLLDQMRLVRHRQFGASSEKSEYAAAQLNLFNEAEVFAAPETEPELTTIEKHYLIWYKNSYSESCHR